MLLSCSKHRPMDGFWTDRDPVRRVSWGTQSIGPMAATGRSSIEGTCQGTALPERVPRRQIV